MRQTALVFFLGDAAQSHAIMISQTATWDQTRSRARALASATPGAEPKGDIQW